MTVATSFADFVTRARIAFSTLILCPTFKNSFDGERPAARKLAHLERRQANRAVAALADAGSPTGAQPAVVGA